MTVGVKPIETNYRDVANARLDLYLVLGDGVAAIVDAGVASTPSAGVVDRIASALDGRRLTAVLLTHAHVDHVGGADELRRMFGAKIFAPLDDMGWIEDPQYQWSAFWATCDDVFDVDALRDDILSWTGPPFRVDAPVRDNDAILVAPETVHAILTRAHTPGHTCYLARQARVLFTGDYVQGWGTPTADGAYSTPPQYDSVDAYVTGLRRLATTPFESLATAHRGVFGRNAALAELERSEAFAHRVAELTLELADGPSGVTLASLATAISDIVGAEHALSVQSVTTARAHLRHAVRRGSLARVKVEAWTSSDARAR